MLKNYKQFAESMILRDHLALDRTYLANERTLLAYLRTFIGLLAAGVGMVRFIDTPVTLFVGYAMIAGSPFFVVCGISRFIAVHKKLRTLGAETDQNTDQME